MQRVQLIIAAFGSFALLAGSSADVFADHGGCGYGAYGYSGYEYGGFGGGYGYVRGEFGGFRNGGYQFNGPGRGFVGGGYGYGGSRCGCRGRCGRTAFPNREFGGPAGRFDRQGPVMQGGPNRLEAPRSPQGRGNGSVSPPLPGVAPNGPMQNVRPQPKPVVIPEKMKGIGLLPKADQAAALAQKTCPVTNGLLGSHGKPIKVLVQGRSIFVCCAGCIEQVKSNPNKFLKKRP